MNESHSRPPRPPPPHLAGGTTGNELAVPVSKADPSGTATESDLLRPLPPRSATTRPPRKDGCPGVYAKTSVRISFWRVTTSCSVAVGFANLPTTCDIKPTTEMVHKKKKRAQLLSLYVCTQLLPTVPLEVPPTATHRTQNSIDW